MQIQGVFTHGLIWNVCFRTWCIFSLSLVILGKYELGEHAWICTKIIGPRSPGQFSQFKRNIGVVLLFDPMDKNSGVVWLSSPIAKMNSGVVWLSSPIAKMNSGVVWLSSPIAKMNSGVVWLSSPIAKINSGVVWLSSPIAKMNCGEVWLSDPTVQQTNFHRNSLWEVYVNNVRLSGRAQQLLQYTVKNQIVPFHLRMLYSCIARMLS